MKYLLTISFLLSFVTFSQHDSEIIICPSVPRDLPNNVNRISDDSLKIIKVIPITEDSIFENEELIINESIPLIGVRYGISPKYPGGPIAMRGFIDSCFVYPIDKIQKLMELFG
jgi:hypothetical protein